MIPPSRESLESPRYPWEIDQSLAETGRIAFEQNCARCHGTYGKNASYPERTVPIDEVQTDPVRLKSLSIEYRHSMRESWFGRCGIASRFAQYCGPCPGDFRRSFITSCNC